MPKNKNKAFTLTELLVVVVIIGVLAAVVLPKFSKVLETRKTTEAEVIMAAVRTEQERRCALDKPYIGDIDKLVTSQVLPQTETKHFTYQLEPSGILATSKGKYSYELKMPSYADGRICCEGNECTKLNKDYPTCDELARQEDFRVSTSCTAEIPEVGAQPQPIKCNNEHYQGEKFVMDYYDGDLGGNKCGADMYEWRCEGNDETGYVWIDEEISKATTRPEDETRPCPNNRKILQRKKYTCVETADPEKYKWALDKEWTPSTCSCEFSSEEVSKCENPSPSGHHGVWNESACDCDCPDGTHNMDGQCVACPGMEKEIRSCNKKNFYSELTGQWNYDTCSCDCPKGSRWDDKWEVCEWRYKARLIDATLVVTCGEANSAGGKGGLDGYSSQCSDNNGNNVDFSDCTVTCHNRKDECDNSWLSASGCKPSVIPGIGPARPCKPKGTTMPGASHEYYANLVFNANPPGYVISGTRLGGQIIYDICGSGTPGHQNQLPDCEGTDYDTICRQGCVTEARHNRDCQHTASARNYRCVLSKNITSKTCTVEYGFLYGSQCFMRDHLGGTAVVLECVNIDD